MELQPDTVLGNFFNRQHRTTSSYQVVHAVTGHRQGAGGSHVFKVGVDLLHTQYNGTSKSQTVLIERADGTVVRRLDFPGNNVASVQAVGGTEAAVFAQDRLQPHPRWYVEAGLRVDRDGVLGRANLSPRFGTAVLLNQSGAAVLRGGWGFVRGADVIDGRCVHELRELHRHPRPAARRGVLVTQTVAPNLETAVEPDVGRVLRLSLERTLGASCRRVEQGRPPGADRGALVTGGSGIERRLSSDGRSSYRDVELGAHYTRGSTVDVDMTYTRSRSEGDLNVLASSFDSVLAPIIGENAYAALNTDVPHRLFIRGRVMPTAEVARARDPRLAHRGCRTRS